MHKYSYEEKEGKNIMKKTLTAIILTTILSLLFSTTAMAATYESGLGAEWDAYMAEMEQNSNIARQNKAIYDASATKLQKKVDALIAKAQSENVTTANAAVAELINLKNSTQDWSSNYYLPFDGTLPAKDILIKTGYSFDGPAIAEGDLRTFIWVIEDGEVCSFSLNALPDIQAAGGVHESVEKILNHPKSGVVRNPDGSEWYWGPVE